MAFVRYAFGDFELDADAYELRRAGAPVRLQPKVFHLIRYLVERRDRVVDKDELFGAIWANEHVTESSLFVCVRAARAALGQAHAENHPIATVRGRGYRFVAVAHEAQLPNRPSSVNGLASTGSGVNSADSEVGEPDPFVGRDEVMQTLRHALAQATAGNGRMVIVSGEPGIGKTRCMEELANLARAQHTSVWTGRSLEGGGAPAFWPLIQILRQLEASVPGPSATEAKELLGMLVPRAETAEKEAAERAQADETRDRFWLFDRIARLFCKAAESAPRVLLLDDLQWADDSSLRSLQVLADQMKNARCLVVATMRDPRTDADESREKVLRRLARTATQISLAGLGPSEIDKLVVAIAGASGKAELGPKLYARTAGNPLFLREVLRLLLSHREGAGAGPGTAFLDLPQAVRDLVHGRTEALDEASREMLGAASVLGREFEVALLSRVANSNGTELVAALDRALKAQLIATTATPNRYAFTHDLFREVIYDDLSQTERVRYHRRAGEAMELRSERDRWQSEIAHHFHCALADGQHAKVLQYARSAGETAMRVFAFADAVRFYGWAREALDFHDQHRAAHSRRDLRSPRQRAHRRGRLQADARSSAQRHRSRGPARLRRSAGGRWHRPSPHHRNGRRTGPARATRTRTRARTARRQRSAILFAGSQPARVHPPYSHDMKRSKELTSRAVALASATGAGRRLLEALEARLFSLTGPDDADEFLTTAAQMLAFEKTEPVSWSFGEAHYLRYHVLLHRADRTGADQALADFGRVVHALPYAQSIHLYDRLRAQQAFFEGRFAEAEKAYNDLFERGRRGGMDYNALSYAIQMMSLRREREGIADLADQPAIPLDTWDLSGIPSFQAGAIWSLLMMNQRQVAAAKFDTFSQNSYSDLPRDLNYLFTLTNLASAAVVAGRCAARQVPLLAHAPVRAHEHAQLVELHHGVGVALPGRARAVPRRSGTGRRSLRRGHRHERTHGLRVLGSAHPLRACAAPRHRQPSSARARAKDLALAVKTTSAALGMGPLLRDAETLLAKLTV